MQDKYKGERVLVFSRATLDELGSFQGISGDTSRFMDVILDKSNNRFYERYLAEDDPSRKQIIPYVMFRCGDEIFSYVRGKQAGEKRLVGNRSVGIGGHINPKDEQLLPLAPAASSDIGLYLEAVRREIAEEVIVDGEIDPKIVALINDDSDPVGRVHFGIVHLCDLDSKSVRKREQQITESGFISIEDLAGPRRKELETWSALAIDYLTGL